MHEMQKELNGLTSRIWATDAMALGMLEIVQWDKAFKKCTFFLLKSLEGERVPLCRPILQPTVYNQNEGASWTVSP